MRQGIMNPRTTHFGAGDNDVPGESSNMLGGASHIVSKIRVKCNGT